MSLTKYKLFENLHYQDSNYIYVSDRSVWPIGGQPQESFVLCGVWYLTEDPSSIKTSFFDEQIRFNVDMTKEYELFLYLVKKWVAGAYAVGDIVWHNDYLWKCVRSTLLEPPTPPKAVEEWEMITEENIEELNTLGEIYSDHYFIKPTTTVGETQAGNLTVTKIDDHKFQVNWNVGGVVISAKLLDYKSDFVKDLVVSNNIIPVELEKDGAYSVSLRLDDNTTHYAEIYDMTDAEKCYLDLIKNILCDCLTCEDCPGENYERALNFANMYQLLMNMLIADQVVRVGLMTTDVLREEYLSSIGLLIAKLAILTGSCLCQSNPEY